ncbi:MAG: hypothetical protein FWB72_02630 [Firmicutes bacterium]|nr:hypothetical protein [Bacillota bacterium]
MSKNELFKNQFYLRLNDSKTIDLLSQLIDKTVSPTGTYKSENALLNAIVDEGIKVFVKAFIEKNLSGLSELTQSVDLPQDIYRSLKQIERTLDEFYVRHSIVEKMLAALFNARIAELSGTKISADDLLSGILMELPGILGEIKDMHDKARFNKPRGR